MLSQKYLAEVPRPLPTHSVQNHLDHSFPARNHRSIAGKQLQLALRTLPVEHRDRLPPSRLGRSVEFPEVGQRPMLRAARGPHRLDQRVVAVSLAVLAARVRLQEHASEECPLAEPPDKRVGLYYTPFREIRLSRQADLRPDNPPQKTPRGGQLRNFG